MSAWKGSALTLIFIALLVIMFNLYHSVTPKANPANDNTSTRYEAYMDEVEKKNEEYYKKTEAELKKAGVIYDLSLSNQKRFEKLLERWEKQADQMDKVLSHLEKSN